MKNKFQYILILFLLLGGTGVYGQQNWKWGHRVENGGTVAVDGHGNSYVGWGVTGIYPLEGGHNISSTDSGDCVLTSYTCNGTYRWSRSFGVRTADPNIGPGISLVSVAGVDSLGNVYVEGYMASHTAIVSLSTFYIGDTTITPQYGPGDAFIAQFDTAGHFKWVKVLRNNYTPPNPQNPLFVQLAISCLQMLPDGRSYWLAYLPAGVYGEGNHTFTATYPAGFRETVNYNNDLYVLEYDRLGNLLEGHHLDLYFTGTGFFYSSVTRDSSTGSYYLSGHLEPGDYADTLRLGDSVLTTGGGQVGPNPHYTAYVARFDSLGNFRWVTKQSYSYTSYSALLLGGSAIDQAGNIYVSGQSSLNTTFGSITLQGNIYATLIKLDSTGDVLNAIAGGTNLPTYPGPIAFNHGIIGLANSYGGKLQWGNLTARAASNHGNIALARFNAANLSVMSLDSIVATVTNITAMPTGLTTDSKGDFYLSGTFPSVLYVANDTLYNQSYGSDGFIAKFGFSDCNCNPPVANFSYGSGTEAGTPVNFTYTGQTPVDSVLWNFGDTIPATGNQVTHTFTEAGTYMVCATAYNHCGSNMHCESIELFPMGIDKIPGFAQISVYPNPATQTLHISHAPAGTDLGIYNMMGVQVLHTVLRGNKDEVSVGGLAPGVYILQFTDQNGRRGMTKFVKE